jgi:hypothetical protein
MTAETPAAGPRGLGNKGLTVKIAESLGKRAADVGPEKRANLEALDVLREAARKRRQARHRAQERAAAKENDRTRERWHGSRADALERTYLARALECEDPANARGIELACTGCGTIRWVPARCGINSACESCACRKRGALYKRLVKGLGIAHRAALAMWNREGRQRGARPDVALVTFGQRHSGIVKQDRKAQQIAWERLRAWMYVQDNEAAPFFKTWEFTDGTDELGHVHSHAVVIWPWRDLRALDAAWARATLGEGVNVDVSGRKRAKSKGVSASASYACGYVQKQGCSAKSLELRAAWLDCLADGARTYSTSRGLLAAKEPSCSCPECKSPETVLDVTRRIPPRYRCEPTGPPAPS